MSHIVIDARIINSSTGRYVERLISHLESIDITNQYSVLVPPKDRDFWKPTNPNFTVRTVPYDNYSFAEQFGFWRYLKRLNPDLVHFCMPQQPVLYSGKKVTTVHDLTLLKVYNSDKNWLIFHLKQLVGRFVFYRLAHTNDHILTPSEFTKHAFVDFATISPDKVTVTLESADPFSPNSLEPYQLASDDYIVYVGQQSDYKNIARLGDAHQLLLEKHPGLLLVLVGKINASALANQRYFESKGYKNIVFTDFIPDAQKDWLLSHAKAYVFPSLIEGFGLPPLEAMQAKTPVVSSNATCLPEILGDAAEYFEPTNTTDMFQAIDRVISSDTLRNDLVKKGTKRVKRYSWKRMAEQTHHIYLEVLNKKS